MGSMARVKGKKLIVGLLLGAVILFLVLLADSVFHRYRTNRSVEFAAEGNRFQIYRNRQWQNFFVKGVTLGDGKAGGEAGLTKATYARWLKQMARMNVNVVKVYAILPPAFYHAFYEYNLLTEKPIYLLHGIWQGESTAGSYQNPFDDAFLARFYEEIRRTIDVIHGRVVLTPVAGRASGTYSFNVSPYVMGYVFCDEVGADFVARTERENTHVTGFEGEYLYTMNASPFEAWLAAAGNHAITYDMDKYGGKAKLVGWTTWPGNNPMIRPEKSLNIEHINPTAKFNAGVFASYHIYPFNPELMDFVAEPDAEDRESGKLGLTPFRVYLRELQTHHTVPVLITELVYPVFGSDAAEQRDYPSIRAEEVVATLFDSIVGAGITGGVVFDWHEDPLFYYVLRTKFAD